MANIPAQGLGDGGSGGGSGGGGSYESVEFVPITGGPTVTIGGAILPGTVQIEQSGGVNAPTKRTEEGYDYTTRVNREARKATISGWVNADVLSGLKRLRSEKEPVAVVAGVVVLQRATLDDLTEKQSGETKSGAVEVQVDIREAFQAQSGTSNVRAFATSGKKSGSWSDRLFSEENANDSLGHFNGATSSGTSTGNTDE